MGSDPANVPASEAEASTEDKRQLVVDLGPAHSNNLLPRLCVRSPSKVDVCVPPREATESNRMTSELGCSNLCAIEFQQKMFETHQERSNFLFDVLTKGVYDTYSQRTFRFIGHSNSQLGGLAKPCFLRAGTLKENMQCLLKKGNFQSIHNVAKRAKRIGLMFSSVDTQNWVALSSFKGLSEIQIPDVTRNGFTFTDGCGRISSAFQRFLLREVPTLVEKKLPSPSTKYLPACVQIRYKGYKGVMVVDPHCEASLVFHPSQQKFQAADSEQKLGIVKASEPYRHGALSGLVIELLIGLGVPLDVFERKQQKFLRVLHMAGQGDVDMIAEFLMLCNKTKLLTDFVRSPALNKEVKAALKSERDRLTNEKGIKLRIPLEKARLVFGVADTTQLLEEGECFINFDSVHRPAARVMVTRSPCYHPGDIRVLYTVSVDDLVSRAQTATERDVARARLECLVDVAVFPIKGTRPHVDEMSGGDLDGDEFLVIWDPDLMPPAVAEPASYETVSPAASVPSSYAGDTEAMLAQIRYFINFSHVQVARCSAAWKYWARAKGVLSVECREINALFSSAVDTTTTGASVNIPRSLRPPAENNDATETSVDVLENNQRAWLEQWLTQQPSTSRMTCASNSGGRGGTTTEPEGARMCRWDLIENLPVTIFSKVLLYHHCGATREELEEVLADAMWDTSAHERTKLRALLDLPRLEGDSNNVFPLYNVCLAGDTSAVTVGGTRWHLRNFSTESCGLLASLTTTLGTGRRTLLIMRVRSQLTLALLLIGAFRPQENPDASTDTDVSVNQNVVVFALSPTSRRRAEVLSPGKRFKVCIAKSLFQLYEAKTKSKGTGGKSSAIGKNKGKGPNEGSDVRADTFVYIKLDQPERKNNKGRKKGCVAPLVRPTSPPKCMISVALQKFDARGALMFGGLLTKHKALQWEIYSSSDSVHPHDPGPLLRDLYLGADPAVLDLDAGGEQSWLDALYPSETMQDAKQNGALPRPDDILLCECPVALLEYATSLIRRSDVSAMKALLRTLNEEEEEGALTASMVVRLAHAVAAQLVGRITTDAVLVHLVEFGCLVATCDSSINRVYFLSLLLNASHDECATFAGRLTLDYELLLMAVRYCSVDGLELRRALLQIAKVRASAVMAREGDTGNDEKSRVYLMCLGWLVQLFLELCPPDDDDYETMTCGDRVTVAMLNENDEAEVVDVHTLLPKFNVTQKAICVRVQYTATPGTLLKQGSTFALIARPALPQTSTQTAHLLDYLPQREQRRIAHTRRLQLPAVVAFGSVQRDPVGLSVEAAISCATVGGQSLRDAIRENPGVHFYLAPLASLVTISACAPAIISVCEHVMEGEGRPGNEWTIAERLVRTLNGSTECVIDGQRLESRVPHPSISALNQSQCAAVQRALERDITLCQGPPGCGKTFTLSVLVRELATAGCKVLVTAETNNAVDNLLLKTVEVARQFSGSAIVRVGDGAAVAANVREWELTTRARAECESCTGGRATIKDIKKAEEKLLNTAAVVFATSVTAAYSLRKVSFDTVVVDEATQIKAPQLLAALQAGVRPATHVVLMGDHKQMGPCDLLRPDDVDTLQTTFGAQAFHPLRTSIFETLIMDGHLAEYPLLRTQYRMVRDLVAFPNCEFYDGKLETDCSAENIPVLIPQRKAILFIDTDDGVVVDGDATIHCKEQYEGSSYKNIGESQIVEAICKKLRVRKPASGCTPSRRPTVAVLTGYKKQLALLKERIAHRGSESPTAIDISSLDAFQGREADTVVFSGVRTRRLGFLTCPPRVNVLLTRAKSRLIVVASRRALQEDPLWARWVCWLEENQFGVQGTMDEV